MASAARARNMRGAGQAPRSGLAWSGRSGPRSGLAGLGLGLTAQSTYDGVKLFSKCINFTFGDSF